MAPIALCSCKPRRRIRRPLKAVNVKLARPAIELLRDVLSEVFYRTEDEEEREHLLGIDNELSLAQARLMRHWS